MPSRVTVSTGARLHFGLLAHAPQAKRQFGGVGLMVEHPGFRLTAEVCDNAAATDAYAGPDVWRQRVLDVVCRCRELSKAPFPGCQWSLPETIDHHVGLGSGTQLALAVARAFLALQGEATLDATELARRAGRGLRSALGIHGFQEGGLLVEGGKRSTEQVSPAVARVEWPEEWPLLLVRPRNVRGLCGAAEIEAFAGLPPMSGAVSAQLCQLALLELLPATLERDFEGCSEALFQFGQLVGEYFAPAQGGVYSSPQTTTLVEYLRGQGVRGVGQSSWGPTVFVVCPDKRSADSLSDDLLGKGWGDCEILCTSAKNAGAKVEVSA
ncbi:MAG: hypothetical protein JWN70_854 [Planctomycetaceae bacterium]|nr:hypothetical protein [Planctomycetaceae bacterium]